MEAQIPGGRVDSCLGRSRSAGQDLVGSVRLAPAGEAGWVDGHGHLAATRSLMRKFAQR